MLAKVKRKMSSGRLVRGHSREAVEGGSDQKGQTLSKAPSLESQTSTGSDGLPRKRAHINKMLKLFGRFSVANGMDGQQHVVLNGIPHDMDGMPVEGGLCVDGQLDTMPRRLEGFPGVPSPVDGQASVAQPEQGAGVPVVVQPSEEKGSVEQVMPGSMRRPAGGSEAAPMPPRLSKGKTSTNAMQPPPDRAVPSRGASFLSESGLDLTSLVNQNQLELLFSGQGDEELGAGGLDGKTGTECSAAPECARTSERRSSSSDPVMKFLVDSARMSSLLQELEGESEDDEDDDESAAGSNMAGVSIEKPTALCAAMGVHYREGLPGSEPQCQCYRGPGGVSVASAFSMKREPPVATVLAPAAINHPTANQQQLVVQPSASCMHGSMEYGQALPRAANQILSDEPLRAYNSGMCQMPCDSSHMGPTPNGSVVANPMNGQINTSMHSSLYNTPQLAQQIVLLQQMPVGLPTATAIPLGTPLMPGANMYSPYQNMGSVSAAEGSCTPQPPVAQPAHPGYGLGMPMAAVAALPSAPQVGSSMSLPVASSISTVGNPPTAKSSGTSGNARVDNAPRNVMGRKEWSAEEDRTILEAVDELGQKWRVVAQRLAGRSDDAVRNRWKRLNKERIASAADTTVAASDVVESSGAMHLMDSSRSASSRETSLRHDSPEPRRSWDAAAGSVHSKAAAISKAERLPWTPAEDTEIVRSVQQLGLKWQKIAARLPGSRTPHAVRNRFYRLQQLQQQQQAQSQQHGDMAPVGHRGMMMPE